MESRCYSIPPHQCQNVILAHSNLTFSTRSLSGSKGGFSHRSYLIYPFQVYQQHFTNPLVVQRGDLPLIIWPFLSLVGMVNIHIVYNGHSALNMISSLLVYMTWTSWPPAYGICEHHVTYTPRSLLSRRDLRQCTCTFYLVRYVSTFTAVFPMETPLIKRGDKTRLPLH